jgi:subtilisin family serine protease
VAIAAASVIALAPSAAQAADLPGRYIVVYERSVSSPAAETDRQERARGFEARFVYRRAIKGFAAELSPGQVSALRADPDVADVVPDRPVEALSDLAPGEPLPPTGVRRMRAATASTAHAASGAAVAVIDSGIDLDHPDLNARDGTNCITPGTAAEDGNGHGTHVAGVVGARNNGSGVVGAAPGTPVYAVKVLNAAGNGSTSSIICGIDWVATNADALGIEVANMSLGGDGDEFGDCGASDPDPEHRAVCRLTAAGVLQVVAAGNDAADFGGTPPTVPAAYPEVLTVTAVSDSDGEPGGVGDDPACRPIESDDEAAGFSNFATEAADQEHTIAAPGVCIRSTWLGGEYRTRSGTSMASPHVAGAAALCIAASGSAGPCDGMTPAAIAGHLRDEAADAAAADPLYSFAGSPLDPQDPAFYGHLVVAEPPAPGPDPGADPGPADTPDPPADPPPASSSAAGPPVVAQQPPPAVVDTTAPLARLASVGRNLTRARRFGLPVVLTCSEACTIEARLVVGGRQARRLRYKPGKAIGRLTEVSLAAGRPTTVGVPLSTGPRKRVRRLRSLRVTLVVTATDAAGNTRTVERRLTLSR